MIFTIKITTQFECSLERAFKTPILCDVSKVHTGYGMMPKITHTTNDENWGTPGSYKKVYSAKSLFQKAGFASIDRVLERVENKYWRIQVDEFQTWVLGFNKFVGEWKTTEIEKNQILVEYTYHLHTDTYLWYPLNWLFANKLWKNYMNQVLENVKNMAYEDEPYLYH